MANEEHVRALYQGPEAWNEWRRQVLGEDFDLAPEAE
jgi:hypothetical protein